ncbi:MAG: dehydrogenase [Armatimonadetes bacterium]|nr:dehydrogenase [Armatimonadota bacterium]MDE2205741.1 dehydrogenase [Armatimonadota bacterium]
MPKSLLIDPVKVRKRGEVLFAPIPVNEYGRTLKQERANFSDAELVRMLRDMTIIRTFETMLNDIKLKGSWSGIEYNHKGPAHLSIGQEASAVGQAWLLDCHDHIFGSHRSHGEILAKGLSAIDKLDDTTLTTIMETSLDGETLRAVERTGAGTVHDLAVDFLLYGALAEIFGREAGFNRGMGGSMHAFFTPFGIYPNNAIVGGSADIATGAALFKRIHRGAGIVICNIGDASASCGPTWEALSFATMDQFKTLWDSAHRGGLPLIFNFVNNFYGMGGQPVGETGGMGILARLGAGLSPTSLHAERVDGYNPLAVVDAIRRKRQTLERGDGPVLLDTVTYRYSGHSPSDASSYREKSEIDAWRKVDSLEQFGLQLEKANVLAASARGEMEQQVQEIVARALRSAADLEISPRANLMVDGNLLERTITSNQHRPVPAAPAGMETAAPWNGESADMLEPITANARSRQLEAKSRSGLDGDGTPLPRGKCLAMRDALYEAILPRLYADPTLALWGEENRDWGGAFAVYRGLTEATPYHRLFNSPIAEGAIVGAAVGYALEGGRALVELMYCDFMGRAGDELFNQLAKWQAMSGGTLEMPVVVRVSVGSKYGAQHSQDWTALVTHIPGLKVVFPATPYDARGLMTSALTGSDPVIFFESQRLYDMPEVFHPGGVPRDEYRVEIGKPDIKRSGSDVTILTVGATLYRALEAADRLKEEFGVTCEVIDARSLTPFDYTLPLESVRKTGRILLASDACERGSVLQTFAATIGRLAFDDLDAPPVVVGARNWITPPDELEEAFFPYPTDILDAIHENLLPLKGYKPVRPCGGDEVLRRSRLGV